MARSYLKEPANQTIFAGTAAIWISTDSDFATNGTLLDDSAELTITGETTEMEFEGNSGGLTGFDDVLKTVRVSGKFQSTDEKIRQMWDSSNSDQSIAGTYFYLWIQTGKYLDDSDASVYGYYAINKSKFKQAFTYAAGTSDPRFGFETVAIQNGCADVTITPPTGDDCYITDAVTSATLSARKFFVTADGATS